MTPPGTPLPNESRPRYAFFCTDFPPIIGGIAQVLRNLIVHTASQVHWYVLTTTPEDSEAVDELKLSLRRLRTPRITFLNEKSVIGRKIGSIGAHFQVWANLPRLAKEISGMGGVDGVVIGNWSPQSIHWCRYCRKKGIPYYILAHAYEVVMPVSPPVRRARVRDFRQARVVFTGSVHAKSLVGKLGVSPDHTKALGPGVDVDALDVCSENILRMTLAEFGLIPGEFILGLGRLVPVKGFDLLVSAFERLAGKNPKFALVIAGDGPEIAVLQQQVRDSNLLDRVRFIGAVHPSSLTKKVLLQGCAFLVMPGRPLGDRSESLGNVFLEAARYGRPSIGGAHGGVSETIIDGSTGLVVDMSHDVTPLVTAMDLLLSNPELSNQLGARARHRVLSQFTAKQQATQFLETLWQSSHGTA